MQNDHAVNQSVQSSSSPNVPVNKDQVSAPSFFQTPTGKALVLFGSLALIIIAVGLIINSFNTKNPQVSPTPSVSTTGLQTPIATASPTSTGSPTNTTGTTNGPDVTPATYSKTYNTGYCEITAELPNTWDSTFTPGGEGAGNGYVIKYFTKNNPNYGFQIIQPDGGVIDNYCGQATNDPSYKLTYEPILLTGNEFTIRKCYVNNVFQSNLILIADITAGSYYFNITFNNDDKAIKEIINTISFKNCRHNIT